MKFREISCDGVDSVQSNDEIFWPRYWTIFFPQKAGFLSFIWRIFTCRWHCGPQNYFSCSKDIEWENISRTLNTHWQDGENLSSLSCSDISTSSPETNYSSVTPW